MTMNSELRQYSRAEKKENNILKQERVRLMDEYINQKGFVSMDELCNKFSVSINTVRLDVKTIIAMGHAKKTYGGVTSILYEDSNKRAQAEWSLTYGSYESRLKSNYLQKQKIAELAAGFICDNDIVFLDVGTTCYPIIDYIPEDYNVVVISNDLNIINKAARRANIKLLSFGGTYSQETNSFKCSFPALQSYLKSCNISKAFLGTTGVSPTGQITTSENFGREVRSSLLKICPSCYLLADASKFGKVALFSYGSLSDATGCISDEALPDEYRKLFEGLETELILAKVPEKMTVAL